MENDVILTVTKDSMGIALEINADAEDLIFIIKAISEALLEQTGTQAH